MADFYDSRRNIRYAWYASVKEKLQTGGQDWMDGAKLMPMAMETY